MTDYYNDNELAELIFTHLNGTANDVQHDRLEDMLSSDPKAVDYYFELISIYSGQRHGLKSAGSSKGNANGVDQATPSERTKLKFYDEKWAVSVSENKNLKISRIKRSLFGAILAAAAVFLVFATVLWTSNSAKLNLPIAVVVDAVDVVWDGPQVKPQVSSELSKGRLELLQGVVKFKMKSGVEVIAEAPASIELESPDSIFLHSGNVTCKAPEGVLGFVVRTDKASVVDYGTEFGVSTRKDGQTDVHVFDGEVDLRDGPDPVFFENSKRLIAGQAANVNADGILSATVDVANESGFLREIPVFWTGRSNKGNSWNNAGNWLDNKVPGVNALCRFESDAQGKRCAIDQSHSGDRKVVAKRVNIGLDYGPCYVDMTGGEAEIGELWIGRRSSGVWNMSAGSIILTIPGGRSIIVGHNGGDGTFNMSGGMIDSIAGDLTVGTFNGNGIVNLKGGQIRLANNLLVVGGDGGTGIVNIEGGLLSAKGLVILSGVIIVGDGVLVLDGYSQSSLRGYIESGNITALDAGKTLKIIHDLENIEGYGNNKTILRAVTISR